MRVETGPGCLQGESGALLGDDLQKSFGLLPLLPGMFFFCKLCSVARSDSCKLVACVSSVCLNLHA